MPTSTPSEPSESSPETDPLTPRFTTLRRALLLGTAALACGCALAQPAWPDRPIKLIVPYTAGGATDIVARLIAQKTTDDTKWVFVVDNRAGGAGNIGLDVVAKSRPDGYTIGMGQTANLAINPTLFPKMAYDALKDFAPIAVVASQPVALVVRADAPWKSLAELVAAAKARPGELKQALAGTGTLGHMAGELLASKAGFKVLNVPYKGAAPAITDVIAGHVNGFFGDVPGLISFIKGGKLKPIGIASDKRNPLLPEVRTFAEMGIKGVDSDNWYAVFAGKSVPAAEIDKVSAALRKALADEGVRSRLMSQGAEPASSTPAELAALLKKDGDKWGRVVKAKNIKPD